MNKSRYISREISIGNLSLGGLNPIRVQSMTNTPTLDTEATVQQTLELVNAGCELVRITAASLKEAENLANIKKLLIEKGCNIPLIADIHFLPKAADIAARIVDKVRINPGNYIDKKVGKISWTESEYQTEIEKIESRISPLIKICKEYNCAIRIGSNQGSLSPRIMNRFGDTAEGMVEAAMEFARICNNLEFHNLVLSMKSSNTRTMIYATRLLVEKMIEENLNYPIHLGVTEAGAGEDGRIKSALGIGNLLAEGIGDTIRVSLTESPVKEIVPATLLANRFNPIRKNDKTNLDFNWCLSYNRRKSSIINEIGNEENVSVIGNDGDFSVEDFSDFKTIDLSETSFDSELFILNLDDNCAFSEVRSFFKRLENSESENRLAPIVINKIYNQTKKEEIELIAASDIGSFLVEGFGDAIWIETPGIEDPEFATNLTFSILQAARVRFTKTEFISCPSCGRTKYDIVSTLEKVQKRTGHLKGLTIGVMGCIVNGPGEMAGANYGYVGEGAGKVTLFKAGKPVVKRVDEKNAVDALVKLIKDSGDWVEIE